MRGNGSSKTMVQAVTLLTALRMFTNGQSSCNNGFGGVSYERYPGHQLQGVEDDVIRLSSSPSSVMSRCVEQCTVDRSPSSSLARTCHSFTFQSGRFAEGRWEESRCLLSRERPAPDGLAKITSNQLTEYFNEICLKKENLAEKCGNKTYSFTVWQNTDFEPVDAKAVTVNSRQACMDRCLEEGAFVCRAAVYETLTRSCKLTRFTKSVGLEAKNVATGRKGNYYMENNCVHGHSRCDGYTMFFKEENVQLQGGRDMSVISNVELSDCEALCRDDSGMLGFQCRSFRHNSGSKECVLSEDDSNSLPGGLVTSPVHSFYQMVCIEGAQPEGVEGKTGAGGTELSYLYGRDDRYYEQAVPFQRYRKSIIRADFARTLRNIDLGRCLDECLHQTGARCLSVAYSPTDRECKISKFDQRDSRILYDANFDYYENLVAGPNTGGGSGGYYDNYNGAYNPENPRYQPSAGGDRYPKAEEYPGLPYAPGSAGYNPERVENPVDPGRYRGVSGVGGRRARCDSGGGGGADSFRQVRSRTRMRQQFIKRLETVNSLYECEQECLNERTFKCLSFNYISVGFSPTVEENCELSDQNSHDLDIENPSYYDNSERYDFYQREARLARAEAGCVDVSQTCDEDGMQFQLRVPEGFRGRIYTHKYYGRSQCFVRGNGGNTYTLRIPGIDGYPDCGTEKYGDTLTNIVVVQFSQSIQTSQDMKYNLTCTTRGPGSAVVTSGYLGTASGQPVPIEYLPAEHTLDSRVRLLIKYQGRPTTTIAVGDPLEFKLETQDGENLLRDIFATNVIAKDPYSDRVVELIDSDGCPLDPYVFPALGLSRAADGLETGFNAFKIPESNFLVFEATVRSCRSGCRPAVCDGPSGRDNSFGRKRRSAQEKMQKGVDDQVSHVEIKEMFRVYESREGIPEGELDIITASRTSEEVCVTAVAYHGLVGTLVILFLLLLVLAVVAGVGFKRARMIGMKNQLADANSLGSTAYLTENTQFSTRLPAPQPRYPSGVLQQQRYLPPREEGAEGGPAFSQARKAFHDPSEPIYSDPSLFERPRSISALSPSDQHRESVKL